MNYLERLTLLILGKTTDVAIGDCYYYGKHVRCDKTIAKSYYLHAATNHSPEACSRLIGVFKSEGNLAESLYYEGQTFKLIGLWKEAIAVYRQAAKLSHANSMLELAYIYEEDRDNLEFLNQKDKSHRVYHRMSSSDPMISSLYKLDQFGLFQYVGSTIVVKKDEGQSIHWYIEAAKGGNTKAIEKLKVISQTNGRAAYVLADYCESNNSRGMYDTTMIVGLYEFAESTNDLAAALRLVKIYVNGELGKKINKSLAHKYLKSASKLKDIHASYRLGRIYEFGLDSIIVNLRLSYKYYYIGAMQNDERSLIALKRVAEKLKTDEVYYSLGEVYCSKADKDILSAIKLFKLLADKGHVKSIGQLKSLAEKNSTVAMQIAELYSSDDSNPSCPYGEFYYYALAALANNNSGFVKLESAVNVGNLDALFEMGRTYWMSKNEIFKAIDCCMFVANKNHNLSREYLDTTTFEAKYLLYIANKYHYGNGDIDSNITLAILFYEKAYKLKDKDAAFFLGDLYLAILSSKTVASQSDYDKICICFIAAATYGRTEALAILEELGVKTSQKIKSEISNLYSKSGSGLSQKWRQSAANDGSMETEDKKSSYTSKR